MIKVTSIERAEPYFLVCRFNNQAIKKLDILPLIENHKNLQCIEQLLESQIFNKARIGKMGQIVWDNIISTNYNGVEMIWDYDISPEFAFENAEPW